MPTPEILHRGVSRRRFLIGWGKLVGAGTGLALVGCGDQKKSAIPSPTPTPDCPEYRPEPTPTPDRSHVQIQREQTLTPEQLADLNVSIFNFSTYNGEIRFTQAFAELVKPIKTRGGHLRIIWVDDSPNESELKHHPFSDLNSLTDEEIMQSRQQINKIKPNEIEVKQPYLDPADNCQPIQEYIIHSSGGDTGGFAETRYEYDEESAKKITDAISQHQDATQLIIESKKVPITTIVIGIKDPSLGYDDLATDFYRTIPKDPRGQGSTLTNRFFHEMKHALDDVIVYKDDRDPQLKRDFDKSLPHDKRPGEMRAIYFAEVSVDALKRGQMPPIIIYAPNGNIL